VAYNRPVQHRTFVIALAFLSISLTGGSCEFRAVSNNSIPSEGSENGSSDPDTGLVVVVRNGESSAIDQTARLDRTTIAPALAASVLSVPAPAPPATATLDLSMPDSRLGQTRALSTVQLDSPRGVNAIPEPGGFWLYGLGCLFLVRLAATT